MNGILVWQPESAKAIPGFAIDLLGSWGESFYLFLFAFIYLNRKGFEDETGMYSSEHNRVLLHAETNVLCPTVVETSPEWI